MYILLIFIIINLFLTIKYKSLCKILNVNDYPDGKRKIHIEITPLFGGIMVFINLIIFFGLYILFPNLFLDLSLSIFEKNINFYYFFIFSCLVMFLGIYDDKYNLNANIKFLLLLAIVFGLLLIDKSLLIESLYFETLQYKIYFHDYSLFFTILCFLLFINAANMYDGINLQLGPYFLFIFFIFYLELNFIFLFSIFIITLLFFCILNLRGKIFLGNNGAYLISFIISYIFIKQNNLNLAISAEEIFLIMFLPGLDMLRLFIYRILNKKNPFSADRMHLHHLILNRFNLKQTQIIIFFLSVVPYLIFQISQSIYPILFSISLYLLIYYVLNNYINKNDI